MVCVSIPYAARCSDNQNQFQAQLHESQLWKVEQSSTNKMRTAVTHTGSEAFHLVVARSSDSLSFALPHASKVVVDAICAHGVSSRTHNQPLVQASRLV